MYNTNKKTFLTPMHLQGAFISNDQRHKKISSCIRGKGNHTLWWIVSDSQILSKDEIETFSAKVCEFSSKAYTIQYFRINSTHFLLHYCRNITHKRHWSIKVQWSIQKNPWSRKVSRSNCNKAFSSPYSTGNRSTDYQSTRFITKEILSYRMFPNQRNIRSGSNSTHSLWQATGSQGWIQPKESWQKMLLTVSLFRIQPPRILAWEFKLWKYPFYNFSDTLYKEMQRQIAKDRKKDSCKSRLCFLRPQIYRISRRRKNLLYNRIKSHHSSKRDNSKNKISSLQEKLGFSRVLLPANDSFSYQMEKGSSFCCFASSLARRPGRKSPVKSLYDKRIWLQSDNNQSQVKAKTYLELPQSKSKRFRTEYQRAKIQLSINEDSNPQFCCKCCLSSNAAICIQYSQLVQTCMPSKRIPIQNIKEYSPEVDINTCETNNNWAQEYTQVSSWLPIQRFVLSTYGKDRKYENLKNLSKPKNIASSQAP